MTSSRSCFSIRQAVLTMVLCTLYCICARSEEKLDIWASCSSDPVKPAVVLKTPNITLPQDNTLDIRADQMTVEGDTQALFEGNVQILRNDAMMRANRTLYDFTAEQLTLESNIHYEKPDLNVDAERALFNTGQNSGAFENARFHIPSSHIHGYATTLVRDPQNITHLSNARYSTCFGAKPDWEFRAAELRLDHDQGFGFAKHATLRFKNIPFFYFPAITFPIGDIRKSGFLIPEFGTNRRRGTELSIPYYWNIAPQADATLTVRNMTQRGTQLTSEWRSLSTWSRDELKLEYLNDSDFGAARHLYTLEHRGTLSAHWSTFITTATASDNTYFNDLGNNLDQAATTQLAQTLGVGGNYEHWNFSGRLLQFQTLDAAMTPANEAYAYRPQLTLETRYLEMPGGLDYTVRSEWASFEHAIRISGDRLDIHPRISRPFGGSAWFLTPATSMHHTRYALNENAGQPLTATEINRTVPLFSLDSGLFFERQPDNSNGYIQTLEPRFFYLYAPYRNQNNLPVFDTQPLDFSFGQLFRENRFIGVDRINDANQLAVAVTSRLLKKSGRNELLRMSIGQLYYAENRKVTLGTPEQTEDRSDFVAELALSAAQRWMSRLSIEWNPQRRETDQISANLRYRRNNDRIINFGYRLRQDILEQAEFSFRWPISQRWRSVGRVQYSLLDEHDVETFAGFEYESCCYTFRIMSRRYLNLDEHNTTLFLQLAFKGFSSVGNDAADMLERGILGYKDPY